MTHFLSEQRHNELAQALVSLSIPLPIAIECLNLDDDDQLDSHLAALVGRLGERCQQLREAKKDGNDAKRRRCEDFLRADLLTFKTYTAEMLARHLPKGTFPQTLRAIEQSLAAIGETNALVLGDMGMVGSLQ
jgi:hypothetical protein